MLGRFRPRMFLLSALAVFGTFAIPASASPASAVTVGPHQYFIGYVFGLTKQNVIQVNCAGPMTTGHPAAGQYVEVLLFLPPVTSAGYTGNLASEINADLTVGFGNPIPVAIFTQYSVKMPIPTTITVPCGGSGQMSFNPDPDVAGTSSIVNVTFISPGA